MMEGLPEGIIDRFRTLSLERIGRVENTWNGLVQGSRDDERVREMLRDVHTLKGDSRIVGFDEAHVLSQKLEDLLSLAGQRQYRVSEDFDLVVTMATQFIGMVLRKKTGSTMTGIDLDGFVRQVDEVLRETRTLPTTSRTFTPVKSRVAELDRLSEPTRQRLAIAATTAYLEYLSARAGVSRGRLRTLWQTLRDELGRMQATLLGEVLARHATAGTAIAMELGKRVDLHLALGDSRVDSRVAEALDTAVLHLVRNAIDHGIEGAAARRAAGKSEAGTIQISAAERAGMIELSVRDDGGGIDFGAVRARAVEFGLLPAARAERATEAELHELLYHGGFSTRTEVTDVSGRGVGLDAVRASLARVGGTVTLATSPAGTTFTLAVPAPVRQMPVYQFLAPGGAVSIAISARWTPTLEAPRPDALEPLGAIQLLNTSRQTSVTATEIRDLVLDLRWGFLDLHLRAATEPVLVTAERVCPTPDDYPIEILTIDGRETVLLRPEHLAPHAS
ncbi:MAG TPA: ATP-binding protein [Kofleriaceae bacterium]|jgi:chemotaxis protein histidine kinase CheA